MHLRPLLLTTLTLGVCAAPAGAVVGGERIAYETVPFYASVGPCGGTLVAPDRVLTAGHCVGGFPASMFSTVTVGGTPREVARYAMHPDFRTTNGRGTPLDDVAILQLAQPVTDVVPAALGGAPQRETRIIGQGRAFAPGSGASEAQTLDTSLRSAVLRPLADAECARAYRVSRGNDGERFDAPRMLCGIDPDGRAPLSSGCNGDSGGPFWSGTKEAPVVHGVVSFGGLRCGADRLPSVFAEVARYRRFITDPSPSWVATDISAPRITGARRAGGRLRCEVSFTSDSRATVTAKWWRQGREAKLVARGATYRVTSADRGRRLACFAEVSNAGGVVAAPSEGTTPVRISR